MILDIARMMLFPALIAFAATSDLFTMTISNRVSLALVAGFLVMAPFSGMDLHEMMLHLGAGAAVLVVAFACFAIGQVGGGDAKVASAVALWFGFDHLLDWLGETVRLLGVPSITDLGITGADHESIAEQAAKASSTKGNPIALSTAQLVAVLRAA